MNAQGTHPNPRVVRWAGFLAAKPTRLTAYLRATVSTPPSHWARTRNEPIAQAIEAS